ncbi:MAG: LysR family transcriptional regulator [Devosia nanyangense]|uniref:LysR family transcriptional regulator n=1 Tax=Devosia nanyangense TaxID=1228055 RepID=A0A933L5N8_9HYPH|nr:LysR family transcriptional regulator [Devosia nanyangense]
MDISLKQLQIFQAVVVAGSITKASRRVGLSQPSISQQLAKLEEKIGAQLIQRNRTGLVSLTPSGEYWFKVAEDMLRRLDQAVTEHNRRYFDNAVILRMGVPPTLRGPFIAASARIASESPGFAKFELRFALTSGELVEQLRLHQLNCIIVNESSIAEGRSSFAVATLFEEPLCWAVPAEIGRDEVERALLPGSKPQKLGGALARYVEMDSNVPMRAKSDEWFRHNLPAATPMFSTMTYAAAVDLVAAGLATAHCPLSLLPGLPDNVSRRVRFYAVDGLSRTVILAMPKHLMTLPAYAGIFNKIVAYAHDEYRQDNLFKQVEELPRLGTVIELPRRA